MDKNDENIKKLCSIYVSEYHLEMKLLPYIKTKMKENKKIIIITEDNLEESIKFLLNKVNIDNKEEILSLNWKNNKYNENIKKNSCLIINGTKNFVENTNRRIKKFLDKNCEILNCYKFDEIKENLNSVVDKHDFAIK